MRKLNREQQRMVEENQGLVPWTLQRFYGVTRRHPEYEDLVSIGGIGLMQAAVTYDPTVGEFSTWATWKIRGAAWTYLRRDTQSKVVPMADVERDRDVQPKLVSALDHEAIDHRVAIMLASLPPRKRRVLELRFAEGRTFREIGRAIGVNHQRACRIQNDTLGELREQWPEAVRLLEAA